jgi:hypothetical protein
MVEIRRARFRAMELITILTAAIVSEVLSTSTPTSVPTRRVSKWPCDRVTVRPQSARAAICRRPVTTCSPNGALSSFPCGGGVFLLYTMRRVNCRRCGIVAVEEVPWGDGKRTLTKAYVLFLARWARRLSWPCTSESPRQKGTFLLCQEGDISTLP